MSTSFQVTQPNQTELTIKVTIQNNGVGTITVQQQPPPPLGYKPPVQHQSLPQPQPQQFRAHPQTVAEKNTISDLLRDFNSLSMNNDPVQLAGTFPPLTSSMNDLGSPVQLNRSKRREKANQRARPAAIPIVPEIDIQKEIVRSKGPEGGRPLFLGSGTAKMQRVLPDEIDRCKIEAEEELIRELLDDDPTSHLSSNTPDSPLLSSYNESGSPPSSCMSVSTPPMQGGSIVSGPPSVGESAVLPPPSQPLKRGRGRPPKQPEGVLPTRSTATPRMTCGTVRGGQQLQPRLITTASDSSGFSIASFVPASELAEATRVISRYSDTELTTANERGELLSHTLAKEGNWAKLMACNVRLLNSASLGDIFAGINSTNGLGQTALIEAVMQQNVKAVDYCCLFTCSSDENLFRALVESALLPELAIFRTILDKMCIEMDENGNPAQRTNRFIDKPISGWSFRNGRLNEYAGLTLAQTLTLSPPEFHTRLSMLISRGANPRKQIVPEAPARYRPYLDCVHLAAAFSSAPFECLINLGLKPDDKFPFSWDTTGETLTWCVDTICKRMELDFSYRKSVCDCLNRMFSFDPTFLEGFFEGHQ